MLGLVGEISKPLVVSLSRTTQAESSLHGGKSVWPTGPVLGSFLEVISRWVKALMRAVYASATRRLE